MEDQVAANPLPMHPKLRPVEPRWVEHQRQRFLYLQDPFGFAENAVMVPQSLVPLLALCDGTRDLAQLRTAVAIRTGIQLTPTEINELVGQLDTALLLENGAFKQAAERALGEYRNRPHRPLHHADAVYPSDPDALARAIQGYRDGADADAPKPTQTGRLVGMVSPHIDYERGWATYAQMWERARPHLDDIELVLMFGTDHSGGLGQLTLTRQSYGTPLGVLPTDIEVVDGLADAIGPDRAYEEEIHHIKEHSIELALVWMHYFMEGRVCPMVPILCGSFHHFVNGDEDPAEDRAINTALEYLARVTEGRRTLVIAAGDLAHVGPAFGDPTAVDVGARQTLKQDDFESIEAICQGDAARFFGLSKDEGDSRKVCGLPPIYLMLRYLGHVRGESLGYDQCLADAQGGSFVSIVGTLLYEDTTG